MNMYIYMAPIRQGR